MILDDQKCYKDLSSAKFLDSEQSERIYWFYNDVCLNDRKVNL